MTSPPAPAESRLELLPGIVPYDRSLLSADLVAGATAAAVVIPQAMGYATVAGLPVEIGLYTCVFPMAVYALLGGARRLSFSTTSTIAAFTGLGLAASGVDAGAALVPVAAGLGVLVGLSLILFRILRLGWVVESVSEAVSEGLRLGVGLTIIADQLPKLLGVSPADNGFIDDIVNVFSNLDEANASTMLLSAVTIGGLLLLRRVTPRVPGPLLAVAGGIILASASAITTRGVALIPEVPSGLPSPSIPDLAQFEQLIPFALAIAFMSYLESMSAARVTREPGDPRLDNNRELFAAGGAGVIGGLFQAMPAGGGFSQTQVNANSGARSQVSGLTTAALAVIVALFLAPLLSDLPEATLASVITFSVLGLVSPRPLLRLWRIDRLEVLIAVVTALGALYFDLLVGVIFGVAATLYLLLRTLNHPAITELRRPAGSTEFSPVRREDPMVPGLLILRIDGGMYTMNIRRIQDEIYRRVDESAPTPAVLLIDLEPTVDTSVTVIDVWSEIDRRLADQGVSLWLASVPTRAVMKLERSRVYQKWVAESRVFRSVPSAVAEYEGAR